MSADKPARPITDTGSGPEQAGGTPRAQHALHYERGHEAEFLDALLRHLDISVSILDENLRYRLLSDATYDLLKIPRDRLSVGDSLSDCHEAMIENGLLTPEMIERGKLSEDEQRRLNERGEREGTKLVQLGDGSTHRFFRKKIENGDTISIASDVSELTEKDRLLEASLMLGEAGYWVYEFATKTYTLSKSLERYLGPEATARVHKEGIISIVREEDRVHFREGLQSLRDGASRFSTDGRTTSKNGAERWNHTDAEIVRDPNGRALRIRAFVRDTTNQRKAAEELEKAKDDAIAASRAKSEFLANMSHEIRTPMNGVLGMAELLAASNLDDRQSEYVKVINNSATALLTIINDILDFSKIEAGALEIDPVPFDLKTAVNDVAALLVASACEKGLELVVDYPAGLPQHFIGDAGRVRQVITNLIGNAIKFTESGHVRIAVDVRPTRDMAVITLCVEDTGIGIAPEKLDRVFEKFTQADGSTTRVYGGTGLGLTISKRIVEMMDGRMHVESTLGEGSRFSVRLPLPRDLNARCEAYDTASLQGKRALVVDDIKVNRRVLEQQLSAWDMKVSTVDDGVQAISALKAAQSRGEPYNLIVLDYLMPGVNGRELASMLRAQTGIRVPPIVMLSSCDKPISSAELAAIGIESYLVKPVRERRLYDTVVRTLSQTDRPRGEVVTAPPQQTLHPRDRVTTITGSKEVQADLTRTDSMAEPPVIRGLAADAEPAKPKQDILVAEDFPLNQDVVRLMLAETPYNPVFAENGKVALDLYTAEPDRFPVILMDVSMPVMDGYEAARRIRSWEERNDAAPVPIVALTGHALKNDRDECLKVGMNDYLTKPVKQSDLLERLERFTGRAVEVEARTG